MYGITRIPMPRGPGVLMTLWQRAHRSCQSFTASAAIFETEPSVGLPGVYDSGELLFMFIFLLVLPILAAGFTLPYFYDRLCVS
jgi:hypothetical protein